MAIYKFKSKATGDVIMLGPNGDQLLRLLGREPSAQGIFDVADIGKTIAALEAAVAADEAAGRRPADEPAAEGGDRATAVSLRRRVWPLVEMLRRAAQAGEPVVWGV